MPFSTSGYQCMDTVHVSNTEHDLALNFSMACIGYLLWRTVFWGPRNELCVIFYSPHEHVLFSFIMMFVCLKSQKTITLRGEIEG